MLREDHEFAFIPLNLDERYQDWGRVDVIIQKLQKIGPIYADQESQLKIIELRQYL